MRIKKKSILTLLCCMLLLFASCGNTTGSPSAAEDFAEKVAQEEARWTENYKGYMQRNPNSTLSYPDYLKEQIPKLYYIEYAKFYSNNDMDDLSYTVEAYLQEEKPEVWEVLRKNSEE